MAKKHFDGKKFKENTNDKFSTENYRNKIVTFLRKSGRKPMPEKELATKCRSQRGNSRNFTDALLNLKKEGVICERRRGFVLSETLGFFKAEVMRLSRTFGFIKRCDSEEEIFVPGKFLCGAMPGDIVLANYISSRSGSPEGEVLDILDEKGSRLSGEIVMEEGRNYFKPDTMSKSLIRIAENASDWEAGDKVLAKIVYRGRRHADHRVKILMTFGSAEKAHSCAESMLIANDIPLEFSENAAKEAKKLAAAGVWPDDFRDRTDLRERLIFTIDSAESKDLDDAVSIERTKDGYALGVHIADVSHYVRGNSPLDKDALDRGTSIYYADRVIPMLPKELSNGICSLNPDEDRLSFSAFMTLDSDGNLKDYKFEKSVIRSRVKGVYAEINRILDGSADEEILSKYKELIPSIGLMNELADKRLALRKQRGTPEIETSESKLIINEDSVCVDVIPRTRGKSEMIIEEFMLLANESAARLAKENEFPFVYRVHEQPSPEKISDLKEAMERLEVEVPKFSEAKPSHLAQILENAKDKPCYPAVNMMTLRSMAKAKYEPEPKGHFGLALDDYAHFTSPIRRYPDLAIHRILSDYVNGANTEWLHRRYDGFVNRAAQHSTEMEIRAMNMERDCEDCYKAEYMQEHIGEEFEGFISSVTDFGFYVELPETIEGLVHINSLPEGNYIYDGFFTISDEYSDRKFSVGDRVRVMCSGANVSSGNVDFEVILTDE